MNVIFKTNLDNYQTNCFPMNLPFVPRIGEKVQVVNVFIDYYKKKKLPIQLEVCDVVYTGKRVVCELSYREFDIEKAKLNKVNLF